MGFRNVLRSGDNGFTALLFWDRRTMIRPFEKKVAEIEMEITENKGINNKLLDALYAKKDRKFAEVIKQFNIF
ncbi:MAG TPA: hypothetical protein VK186_16410 [Candidatus Deferrimicrobium sp.]|nr:hypothetical protein [Candidatus Deferrimicrobium sp.]